MRYRRSDVAGGCYFFTVNIADRKDDLLVRHIDALRVAFASVRRVHPFSIIAAAVMPEHLHCIWELPPDDKDFAMRWAQIKGGFSRAVPREERINPSREKKRERGLWQRRYWEHQIRDEQDLARHVDYIHYNPVKHGWVKRAADWPHSSIHRYIRRGWLDFDWGSSADFSGDFGERGE